MMTYMHNLNVIAIDSSSPITEGAKEKSQKVSRKVEMAHKTSGNAPVLPVPVPELASVTEQTKFAHGKLFHIQSFVGPQTTAQVRK